MMQIECYFSVMSPYSYLAMPELARIGAAQTGAAQTGAAQTGAARGVRYLPLHFGSLAQRMGSSLMVDASAPRRLWYDQDLPRQAAKRGLPLNLRPAFWPGNSAPASYAIIAAQDQGGDIDGLVQAFGRALWAEDRDIADDQVVRDVLATQGYDPALADRGMFAAAETYADNLELAVAKGVFGLPFMIWGDQRFWGQDRLDDLELALAQ